MIAVYVFCGRTFHALIVWKSSSHKDFRAQHFLTTPCLTEIITVKFRSVSFESLINAIRVAQTCKKFEEKKIKRLRC